MEKLKHWPMIITIIIFSLSIAVRAQPTELAYKTIKQHEGFRSKPYHDVNHLAIGYDTRLEITVEEAEILLYHRLQLIDKHLETTYTWYPTIPYIAQSVVQNMAYNMGKSSFATFKKMHYQLARRNFPKAAIEMRASLWCRQVKTRCTDLYNLMRNSK